MRRRFSSARYEMGRQPFGLGVGRRMAAAPPGGRSTCVDAAKEKLPRRARSTAADLIGVSSADAHRDAPGRRRSSPRARRVNPSARICAFGLYAPLNAEWLRSLGADAVFGGEFEEDLAGLAGHARSNAERAEHAEPDSLCGLCGLCGSTDRDRAAADSLPRPRSRRAAAAVEATRRCRCRTATRGWSATPKPAAAAGTCAGIVRSCRSTTGSSASCSRTSCSPTSTRRSRPARGTSRSAIPTSSTVRRTPCGSSTALHAAHPRVSYDVTIKVEHLLQHRDLLPRLAGDRLRVRDERGRVGRRSRCCALFDKGHTRADFVEAVALCRAAGVTLVPTFVAFHPWLTLDVVLRSARHDRRGSI